MQKLNKDDKIGLALGGGAVLGAAHIGVLRALDEFEIPINYIAGTSIGALISSLYAFGKSWEEIEKIAIDLDWFDISGIALSQYGLLSNKKMAKLITKEIGDVAFDDAKIPLAMIATDITSGEKVVLNEGDVATAVMASTCIAGIFKAVELNGRLLVDGGIVENVPISPLKEMGAETIITVDLISQRAHKKPDNIIEIILNALNFALITTTKLQIKEADILIKPNLGKFNMIDTQQTSDLIKAGYKEGKALLEKIV